METAAPVPPQQAVREPLVGDEEPPALEQHRAEDAAATAGLDAPLPHTRLVQPARGRGLLRDERLDTGALERPEGRLTAGHDVVGAVAPPALEHLRATREHLLSRPGEVHRHPRHAESGETLRAHRSPHEVRTLSAEQRQRIERAPVVADRAVVQTRADTDRYLVREQLGGHLDPFRPAVDTRACSLPQRCIGDNRDVSAEDRRRRPHRPRGPHDRRAAVVPPQPTPLGQLRRFWRRSIAPRPSCRSSSTGRPPARKGPAWRRSRGSTARSPLSTCSFASVAQRSPSAPAMPPAVLASIAEQTGARSVHCERDWTPEGLAEERAVSRDSGGPWRGPRGHGGTAARDSDASSRRRQAEPTASSRRSGGRGDGLGRPPIRYRRRGTCLRQPQCPPRTTRSLRRPVPPTSHAGGNRASLRPWRGWRSSSTDDIEHYDDLRDRPVAARHERALAPARVG